MVSRIFWRLCAPAVIRHASAKENISCLVCLSARDVPCLLSEDLMLQSWWSRPKLQNSEISHSDSSHTSMRLWKSNHISSLFTGILSNEMSLITSSLLLCCIYPDFWKILAIHVFHSLFHHTWNTQGKVAPQSCKKKVLFVDNVNNASLDNDMSSSLLTTKNTFSMNHDPLRVMSCGFANLFISISEFPSKFWCKDQLKATLAMAQTLPVKGVNDQ